MQLETPVQHAIKHFTKSTFLKINYVFSLTLSAPWGKTAISTPKSNDIELKKFDFS